MLKTRACGQHTTGTKWRRQHSHGKDAKAGIRPQGLWKVCALGARPQRLRPKRTTRPEPSKACFLLELRERREAPPTPAGSCGHRAELGVRIYSPGRDPRSGARKQAHTECQWAPGRWQTAPRGTGRPQLGRVKSAVPRVPSRGQDLQESKGLPSHHTGPSGFTRPRRQEPAPPPAFLQGALYCTARSACSRGPSRPRSRQLPEGRVPSSPLATEVFCCLLVLALSGLSSGQGPCQSRLWGTRKERGSHSSWEARGRQSEHPPLVHVAWFALLVMSPKAQASCCVFRLPPGSEADGSHLLTSRCAVWVPPSPLQHGCGGCRGLWISIWQHLNCHKPYGS